MDFLQKFLRRVRIFIKTRLIILKKEIFIELDKLLPLQQQMYISMYEVDTI